MWDVGTLVRINNPVSMFHGRMGRVTHYILPDMPNPALVIRLLPAGAGPTVSCHEDELVLLEDV